MAILRACLIKIILTYELYKCKSKKGGLSKLCRKLSSRIKLLKKKMSLGVLDISS